MFLRLRLLPLLRLVLLVGRRQRKRSVVGRRGVVPGEVTAVERGVEAEREKTMEGCRPCKVMRAVG